MKVVHSVDCIATEHLEEWVRGAYFCRCEGIVSPTRWEGRRFIVNASVEPVQEGLTPVATSTIWYKLPQYEGPHQLGEAAKIVFKNGWWIHRGAWMTAFEEDYRRIANEIELVRKRERPDVIGSREETEAALSVAHGFLVNEGFAFHGEPRFFVDKEEEGRR